MFQIMCRENSIYVALYGDSAQNAFDKKTADIKPPIVVLLRFAKIPRKEGDFESNYFFY